MNDRAASRAAADSLKRRVLMTIMALAWISTLVGWAAAERRGAGTPVLRGVFALNTVFHPVMIVVVWRRLLRQRVIDLSCVAFAAGICALCMALRLYSPTYGAGIDLLPLYLWIPVIYVFTFTLAGHKSSLWISLAMLALFIGISVPYLAGHFDQPFANFTIQMHTVSAVLIAALYFFSSYQHRFQIAQLTADELARLANSDALTGIANRRRMTEVIEAELLRFARYGQPFSIILLDIDHFKTVNDRHGHAAGDRTLRALTARTREVLRDVDTLGRWGGEEFVVALPQTGFAETLVKAAALCRHVGATPLAAQPLTVSCGVATVASGDDIDALLQRADAALYAAKGGGRNRAEGKER